MKYETMLTKKEIANIFQVSQPTINRWMLKGLPHHRLGYNLVRYDYCEVLEWVKSYECKKSNK